MPQQRFKRLAAVAWLVASCAVPAICQYEETVKGPGDLAKFAASIQSSPNRGTHTIKFAYYGNVGTFKVDSPSDFVESLTFQRSSQDSDGVIRVENTFLDIKDMSGKVVLKGLAFQLATAKAVLVAGADGAKINGSLLIDSCFIFADALDNTFLSWLGDNLSSIEIRNSFLVIKESKAISTRMALSAGTVRLNNNLINFSGGISATNISKRFEFFSNTVNRTQVEITGKLDGGLQPVMEFTQNLFAHHGTQDAFGGTDFWVLSHAGFNEVKSPVQYNKMYKTWKGFNFLGVTQFNPALNNLIIDTIAGKSASEPWNWYTEGLDSNQTGLLSGEIKRFRHNILPGETTWSWPLTRGNLSVTFQPAPYPRTIRLDTLASGRPDTLPFLRRVFPTAGVVQFGAFRTEKIVLNSMAAYGKPALLANDSTDKFTIQNGPGQYKANPSVFTNGSPMARQFVLANMGNTPRGDSIRPQAEGLTSLDKVLFVKVDSAGETVITAPFAHDLPNELRSLSTSFEVKTSALIDSKIILGAKETVTPFSPDKVFWYFKMADTLVQAKKTPGPDSQKYVASARFSSAKGEQAYLVEWLSVPRGGKTFATADGSIQAESIAGFQLKVDSSHVLDTRAYGKQSKGYSFTWPLKAATDKVSLIFKAKPDQELYVKVGDKAPEVLDYKPDSTGNIRIPIADVDSAKVYFMAVKWNVLAGTVYDSLAVDTVTVKGFESITSGRLGFDPLSSILQNGLGAVVKDYRFLGGRQMRAVSIGPKNPFTMSFNVKENLNAAKIDAYFHDGQAWSAEPMTGIQIGKRFTLSQVPANAKAVAVVERLQSAETYVTNIPVVAGNTITLLPKYVNDSIRHITHYCLDLKSVNAAGKVDEDLCGSDEKTGINQQTVKPLVPGSAYQYRIQYFIGEEKINGRQFEILDGTRFNPMSIVQGNPEIVSKDKHRWHLIGFPVTGLLSKIMVLQNTPLDSNERDTTVVLRVAKTQGKAPFDTLKDWRNHPVKPGDAFFMASARAIKTTLQPGDTALPLKPYPIKPDTGWNFISNPFPTDMALAKIRSVPKRPLTFHRLVTTIHPGEIPARKYSWAVVTGGLQAFYGYAFYSVAGEQLVFDPLADTVAPIGKTASKAVPAELQARIDSPWGSSQATLSSVPGQIDIPFLPTPASGPQLRLGGKNGYMIKSVSDPARIDEAMEIRSPVNGSASFTLTAPLQAGMTMRLIDLGSGKVYDEAAARNLPVTQGSRSFRLIAGDEAFVEARTRSFRDAAPREIGISQNYPNPFRGRTKVELHWPVWNGGARKAVLEVLGVQGRIMDRIDLGEIRVGRQTVTLDATTWSPGVYLYRLTVDAGGRTVRLQKRMLVSK